MNHEARQILAAKIRQLEGLNNEDRAALLELLNTKQYGLVWENKPENVEERLREELPVLREDKDRAIVNGEDYPNHILIEGDNLEALTTLSYTHEGKIDVIYIDPPYNTGNEDFLYNDDYMSKEDAFLHSTWLSFMNKRLKIAKRLLSANGIIFISIDDNELCNLKLLCDSIFNNMINLVVVKSSETSGVKMSHIDKKLPKIKEYILMYSVNQVEINPVSVSKVEDLDKFKQYAKYYSKIILNKEEEPENWVIIPLKDYFRQNNLKLDEDEIVQFKIDNADRVIYRTNNKSLSNMYFPTPTAKVISPQGLEYIWWEGKQMLFLSDYIKESLCDLWTDISTINLNKEICDLPSFKGGQKPIELLKRVLSLSTNKDATVLDFFAGSGTTMHTTLLQNEIDGGKRNCILVQAPEPTWVEDKNTGEIRGKKDYEGFYKLGLETISEIAYERNKRAIQGYVSISGQKIDGLINNNLRFYQTNNVSRERTMKNMRILVNASTDLLCIKEDMYKELPTLGTIKLKPTLARLFANGDRQMLIIYREEVIQRIVEELETLDFKEKLKVYLFSPGRYAFDDEFFSVQDKVTLCALPAAIYDAYQKVMPKRKVKLLPEFEEKQNDKLDFEERGNE